MDVFVVVLLSLLLKALGSFVEINIVTTDMGPFGPYNLADTLAHTVHMNNYSLSMLDSSSSSFKFMVKACSDVNVYLSSTENMDSSKPFYEVVFGGFGGTKNCIGRRRDDLLLPDSWLQALPNCLAPSDPNSLPKCTEFKGFWVSWKEGHVKLGSGNVINEDTSADWIDPNPVFVKGVGISTSWGSSGEWKLPIEDLYTGYYSNCDTDDIKGDLIVIESLQTDMFKCCALCNQRNKCVGYNYQIVESRCELLSNEQIYLTTIKTRSIVGWRFYTKCFRDADVCLGCKF